MKILLVNDYATLIGGAEVGLLGLREGLRQRGHDARLFASSAGSEGGKGFADYECFGTASRFRTLLQTANPWAFWQLRRVLAEFQPDMVHVKMFLTQLSPVILPLLKKVPSLYHVVWYRPVCPLGTKMLPDGTACQVSAGAACYHNQCLPLRDWFPLMLQMRLWRQWRKAFNLVIANSAAVKSQLIAEGIQPVEVVWNGIPVRPSRPLLLSPPTVAFAGRLVREKGIDVLLPAFARVAERIPEARLFIAGDGPERDNVRRLMNHLGLASRVILLGHVARSEVEQHFDEAWVQVVPSRWAEPFGIVAIEAMMRGTAVIASNSGGLAEIVQDGQTGLLVAPGDVNMLADALLTLLQDRESAERMGRAGREAALAQFSEATYVDRFVALYQTLCQGSRRSGG